MEKIRVLIMRQDGEEEELWLGNAARVFENILGGEISMMNPLNDETAILYNKDAKRLIPTRLIRNKRGYIMLALYGTIIVTGLDVKNDRLDSLTDEQAEYIRAKLEN